MRLVCIAHEYNEKKIMYFKPGAIVIYDYIRDIELNDVFFVRVAAVFEL